MLSKNDVTDLYLQYGFEQGPVQEQYVVFFSQRGYFQNAEIVVLDDTIDNSIIDKTEYESLGYSVRIKKLSDISSIHNSLFDGFFSTSSSNKRLANEYSSFCLQQERKLAGRKYRYICGEYIEDGLLHSGNVVDRILELFDTDDRQLIILEASAGYGKTCTSFEVVHSLIEKMPTKIPLLAELSKNRKANIFRYVLLSEIDHKFPSLSSELVTNEIKNGRILLIIDGFDELLSKSNPIIQEKDAFAGKDMQTMLDTIAQLVPSGSKTKILLTSRKSAIFSGDLFDNWISDHSVECNITRLQLSPPSLKSWIGSDKINALKTNNINLGYILNPVLLAFIRNESLDDIAKKYTSTNKLVKIYLDLLLQREKERQSLPLTVPEQLQIMRSLAAQLVQYDISAEEVNFIKELLREIIESNLDEYLKRYDIFPDSVESKPSESEFLTKLSQHALLDRIPTHSNFIGFINDFIFGILISEAVLNKILPPKELQGKYLDIAITAYSVYDNQDRMKFYKTIAPSLSLENAQRQLTASMQLTDSVIGTYKEKSFDSVIFENGITLEEASIFENCIFIDCIFKNCKINTEAFMLCQFYNCFFYNISVECGTTLDCKLIFLSCSGHEQFAAAACRHAAATSKIGIDYERLVLEQFWKTGYERAEPRRAYRTLLKGVSANDRKAMVDAIESLSRKNILIKKIRVFELNFEKMSEIRKIVKK